MMIGDAPGNRTPAAWQGEPWQEEAGQPLVVAHVPQHDEVGARGGGWGGRPRRSVVGPQEKFGGFGSP